MVGDRFGGEGRRSREGGVGRGRPELVRGGVGAGTGGRMNSHSPINSGAGVEREKIDDETWWKSWRSWDWREGPLGEIGGKVGGLFGSKWRRTTVLIWVVWGFMSLGELCSGFGGL